jgi:protease I
MNADKLRMNTSARAWVAQFMDQGKLVAAICHAPWLLISADLVEGRRLTSYYTLQDDVRNAGGEWIDQPVVIDNDLITSRHPDDITLFMDAIKTWLGGVPQSDGEE